MSEDRLLHQLGQLANEEERAGMAHLDERWDRLSRGELSATEEAELRALAESSAEAREAWEAFRPLGPDFQAGVVRAIREQGKVLPFRRRAFVAGSLAAVAAAALVILVRPPAPLPDYASLHLSGGTQEMRGEESEGAEPTTFAPGDRLQLILRPQTTASWERRLEARGYLACDRQVRLLEGPSRIEPSGAVMISGSVGDVPPGICTVWVVVGRRGALPDGAELRSRAPGVPVRQRDWVTLSKQVRIRQRGP